MSEVETKLWTTRTLLAWMREAFTKKDIESPRLMAELILSHVIGCTKLDLYKDNDRPANPLERDQLRGLVARALKHEPVQYLVGEAWFFGIPLKVDPRVLIPRPCTEMIVEHILQRHRAQHGPSQQSSAAKGDGVLIADVCTGSGCLAIALAKHLPNARVVASDVSKGALELAKFNATTHGVHERVDFLEGDLLAPLRDYPPTRGEGTLDYLVTNPPYIPDHEWDAVAPNVKNHEPHLALRGGGDGLNLVRPLLREGPALLKPNGQMLVEIAASHAQQALELARGNASVGDAKIIKDFEGLDRMILITRA